MPLQNKTLRRHGNFVPIVARGKPHQLTHKQRAGLEPFAQSMTRAKNSGCVTCLRVTAHSVGGILVPRGGKGVSTCLFFLTVIRISLFFFLTDEFSAISSNLVIQADALPQ